MSLVNINNLYMEDTVYHQMGSNNNSILLKKFSSLTHNNKISLLHKIHHYPQQHSFVNKSHFSA